MEYCSYIFYVETLKYDMFVKPNKLVDSKRSRL